MKFPVPDGRPIMELHGDRVKAHHDSFTISNSSCVVPLDKYNLEVNYVTKMLVEQTQPATITATTEAVKPKEVNIDTNKKPFMINVGLTPKILWKKTL